LAFVGPAAALVARWRTGAADGGRDPAARTAFALGAMSAAYLSSLVISLDATDAFVFSWWAVGAAIAGVAAISAGVAAGWQRSARVRHATRGLRRVVPITLFAVATIAPATVANASARPHAAAIGGETAALAAEH